MGSDDHAEDHARASTRLPPGMCTCQCTGGEGEGAGARPPVGSDCSGGVGGGVGGGAARCGVARTGTNTCALRADGTPCVPGTGTAYTAAVCSAGVCLPVSTGTTTSNSSTSSATAANTPTLTAKCGRVVELVNEVGAFPDVMLGTYTRNDFRRVNGRVVYVLAQRGAQ